MIRALKNRGSEETHRKWGLFIQKQRRQMRGTARTVNYMESRSAEERPDSSPYMMRGKEMGREMALHPS